MIEFIMASRQYKWAQRMQRDGRCRICGSYDTIWHTKAGKVKVSGYCTVHREYQRIKMIGRYKKKGRTKRANTETNQEPNESEQRTGT
jgi:hypothetical protein